MNYNKTHRANLHGFYVKGYKPNPTYRVQEQNQEMGNFLSDAWNKLVSSGETALAKEANKLISNVTGQVQTTVQNIQNTVNPQQQQQSSGTSTTNIVSQPMTDFQKYGLMLGAGFVGLIGVVALIKALK